jgi:phosphoribosylaminoimidazole-succinocarboxamide synthase
MWENLKEHFMGYTLVIIKIRFEILTRILHFPNLIHLDNIPKKLNIYRLVRIFYKKDELNDPMVSEGHILNMGWADPYELEEMVAQAWRINDYLSGLFAGIGIRLVDFKVEFGRLFGEFEEVYILLADEISPDNCRLWDEKTGAKLDKDLFRQDLGGLIEAYQDVAKRLGLVPESGIMQGGSVNEQIASSLGEIENELARERKLRSINKSAPTKPWK